jgi:hypothetical protein
MQCLGKRTDISSGSSWDDVGEAASVPCQRPFAAGLSADQTFPIAPNGGLWQPVTWPGGNQSLMRLGASMSAQSQINRLVSAVM